MLNEKKMPFYFWTEALGIAVYILNRNPIEVAHDMMPEEKYTSRELDISHLKVFDYIAYVHVPHERRTQ